MWIVLKQYILCSRWCIKCYKGKHNAVLQAALQRNIAQGLYELLGWCTNMTPAISQVSFLNWPHMQKLTYMYQNQLFTVFCWPVSASAWCFPLAGLYFHTVLLLVGIYIQCFHWLVSTSILCWPSLADLHFSAKLSLAGLSYSLLFIGWSLLLLIAFISLYFLLQCFQWLVFTPTYCFSLVNPHFYSGKASTQFRSRLLMNRKPTKWCLLCNTWKKS